LRAAGRAFKGVAQEVHVPEDLKSTFLDQKRPTNLET
jgi:hypothetical protein